MVQMFLLSPGNCLVLSVYACVSISPLCNFPSVSGHVLYMISHLFKYAVKKARAVYELNRGVE